MPVEAMDCAGPRTHRRQWADSVSLVSDSRAARALPASGLDAERSQRRQGSWFIRFEHRGVFVGAFRIGQSFSGFKGSANEKIRFERRQRLASFGTVAWNRGLSLSRSVSNASQPSRAWGAAAAARRKAASDC